MAHEPILSLIVWSPLVSALVVLLLPGRPDRVPRTTAFVLSIVPFLLSLRMVSLFDPTNGDIQLTEKLTWMPSLGVYYSLGIDGFSLWLIVLTTFLTPLIFLSAWDEITVRVKEFMFFMLVLEWGMLGALASVDLFLFFMF